jgi:hypothetical protein
MKNFIQILKAIFSSATPTFISGERVNHLPRGMMGRTDGFVIGQLPSGVLVEWPKGGMIVVPATELCRIG